MLDRPDPPDAGSRLIWTLALDEERQTIHVEAREQTRKRERWTAGRAITLDTLRWKLDRIEGATEADRSICALLSHTRTYYSAAHTLSEVRGALRLMAEHPLVYWRDSPAMRVEIVWERPTLRIDAVGSKAKCGRGRWARPVPRFRRAPVPSPPSGSGTGAR